LLPPSHCKIVPGAQGAIGMTCPASSRRAGSVFSGVRVSRIIMPPAPAEPGEVPAYSCGVISEGCIGIISD